MTTFSIKPHNYAHGRAAVEVTNADGELMAVFYATSDTHFRLVSKHLKSVEVLNGMPPVAEIYLRKP